MLYPLKFKPVILEKVWGAGRLKTIYGKDCRDIEKCGESWEISGVESRASVIENGFLAGNDLHEILEIYMEDLVGEHVFSSYGIKFPLLVKLLDTSDYLSLQVHPYNGFVDGDTKYAGKTEMWYILNAEPGSEIIAGFKKDVSRETFLNSLRDKSLKQLLNVYKPKPGDAFFIPAGTLHAIGAGVTLIEIQQASDDTFRVYDWDRPGLDGKPRELHLEKALKVIDFNANLSCKIDYAEVVNSPVNLVEDKLFTVNLLTIDKNTKLDYIRINSFVILCCVEGSFKLRYNEGMEEVKAGQCLLLPSELNEVEFVTSEKTKIAEVYL